MNLQLEYTSYYIRQLGKLFKKYNEDKLEAKVNHTLNAICTQKFDNDMHPHKIYWNKKKKYVIDCHIEGDLIILYTIKRNIVTIEAIGTHKELGISESFNNDDIIDDFLLQFVEEII